MAPPAPRRVGECVGARECVSVSVSVCVCVDKKEKRTDISIYIYVCVYIHTETDTYMHLYICIHPCIGTEAHMVCGWPGGGASCASTMRTVSAGAPRA